MKWNNLRVATSLIVCLALAGVISGCRVQVDKGANGEEKKVQVDTPFGGIHVNTDQTTAADLGLPAYPGAEVVKDADKHKSADVHLGFGEWELRVRAVSYATADTQDQVTAFYKKALTRYGDVLTCKDNAPVGKPVVTAEGLTCSDDGKNVNIQVGKSKNGIAKAGELQLKAGSKRHQHIVGFEDAQDGKTRFALVAIDLPAGVEGKSEKSD